MLQSTSTEILRRQKACRNTVDESQHGLGAVLIQDGQPIDYSSRSLTNAVHRACMQEVPSLHLR